VADLSEIGDFIARDNLNAASRVLQSIRDQVRSLEDQPQTGRPGRIEGTRELVHPRYPYIVAYRIVGNNAEILAVRHTSRRWPERIG
jgi:addiction module RelE/StbE family toxin